MANQETLDLRGAKEGVGEAVSTHGLAIHSSDTVILEVTNALPEPASIGDIYVPHEPFDELHGFAVLAKLPILVTSP